MYLSIRTLTAAIVALLVIWSTTLYAETLAGAVRGEVIDASGGVLPGVTVVATAADGQVLATAITGAAGGYELTALAPGSVRLLFQLEGFQPAAVGVVVRPGIALHVSQRLELAPLTESVIVHGHVPVVPPRPLPPLAHSPPAIVPVPIHDRDSICGPARPATTPESFGTLRSRRDAVRGLYATGDELIINGGTRNGLAIGQNLVVRRLYRASGPESAAATGEHSSGLLQIVAADEDSSAAVVVYACDEMLQGDFLSSFTPELIRSPDPVGIPIYETAARILFSDAGSIVGTPRRLMVIDRGSEFGIRAGQRLTLFRRHGRDTRRANVVGDAIVVAVRTDSATIRVEGATDVIAAGDWAAPQRPVSGVTSVATRAPLLPH